MSARGSRPPAGRSIGLAALAVLLSAGCVCKSLDDLETNNGQSTCADHPCAAGYACGSDMVCHKMNTGGECNDGDMPQACGSDVGECRH